MQDQNIFHIRPATHYDLEKLVELEKEWPPAERASFEQLKSRLEKFPQGFMVAQAHDEIVASIIACPQHYTSEVIENFKTWEMTVGRGYSAENLSSSTNALYIVSGTVKSSFQNPYLFAEGVNSIVTLAQKMQKSYVIAGALIPGYEKFAQKYPHISVVDYVFKMRNGRFCDPLIEKYRRIGFRIPDKNHVLTNYYPSQKSLNYSALVVKNVQ